MPLRHSKVVFLALALCTRLPGMNYFRRRGGGATEGSRVYQRVVERFGQRRGRAWAGRTGPPPHSLQASMVWDSR